MAFDLNAWKERARNRLQGWKPRMQRAGVSSIYAFLSAAAIWPVVEAARSGEWAALAALGSVLAGLGSDVLANRIQNWKDEADAARQIASDVAEDPALRTELDTMLEKVGGLHMASQALAESDRQWFTDTLRAEMAQLGNLARFEPTLRSVVVGRDVQGLVLMGDNNSVTYIVHQYSIQGSQLPDQAALRQQIENYLTWVIDRCGTIPLRGIKRRGQQVVQLDLDTVYVPLDAVDTFSSRSLELDEVLCLDRSRRIIITGGPGSGKTTVLLRIAWALATAIATDNPVLAQEKLGLKDFLLEDLKSALGETDRLAQESFALVDPRPEDPKGTLMTQLRKAIQLARDTFSLEDSLCKQLQAAMAKASELAMGELSQKDSLHDELKTYLEKASELAEEKEDSIPLPIFVPLSAYATHLRHLPATADPQDRTLAAFVSRYLIEKQTSFDLPNDFFQQLMRDGRAVILLLDGLDEVPDEAERVQVRQAVEELVTGRHELRVVVSCRTAAYKDRTALGKGFREMRVKPLEDEHIEALVRQAYADIYCYDPVARHEKADELLKGIHDLEEERHRRLGPGTQRLVSTPLLVRMLLIMHYNERHLPEQRAELYMRASDAMLLPEYALDEEVADRIGRLVGGSLQIHRDLVQHLAFAMHSGGGIQGREISEDDLRRVLGENPSYAPLVDDFIALTRLRGTLLEERLGVYRFIHLAFQEYLVARYLAEIVRGEAGVDGIAVYLEKGPILDSWWREPTLLVAGYLSVTSPQTAQMFLRRLAGADKNATQRNRKLPPDVQISTAEVATTAFLEWQAANADLRHELAERLVAISKAEATFSPTQRAVAGDIVGRLGDPRLEVMTLEGMQFCAIPSGPFVIGSKEHECEMPQHEQNIPYDYWIARYPVTVAQFRAFVEATGHHLQNPDGSRQDLPNQPERWVTWYDAQAFCKWLMQEWYEKVILPKGWAVSLPSEAEWEKAARGGVEIPVTPVITIAGRWDSPPPLQTNPNPTRRYPWANSVEADEPEPNRANYVDTGIDTTSVVGCFPSGVSPYGCEEMSGNVWEWTRSLWEDHHCVTDEEERGIQEVLDLAAARSCVRRGGAFDVNGWSVRSTVRLKCFPGCWGLGFRVVVSPGCP